MGEKNGKKGWFSEKIYITQFGRYEGDQPEVLGSNDSLVGREDQRAYFLQILKKMASKGVYLITGFRGTGKTSFVDSCLREYEADIHSRFLRRSEGKSLFWDKILLAFFVCLMLLGFLLAAEFVEYIFLLQGDSIIGYVIALPAILVCLGPIIYASELISVALLPLFRKTLIKMKEKIGRFIGFDIEKREYSKKKFVKEIHPIWKLIITMLFGISLWLWGGLGAPALSSAPFLILISLMYYFTHLFSYYIEIEEEYGKINKNVERKQRGIFSNIVIYSLLFIFGLFYFFGPLLWRVWGEFFPRVWELFGSRTQLLFVPLFFGLGAYCQFYNYFLLYRKQYAINDLMRPSLRISVEANLIYSFSSFIVCAIIYFVLIFTQFELFKSEIYFWSIVAVVLFLWSWLVLRKYQSDLGINDRGFNKRFWYRFSPKPYPFLLVKGVFILAIGLQLLHPPLSILQQSLTTTSGIDNKIDIKNWQIEGIDLNRWSLDKLKHSQELGTLTGISLQQLECISFYLKLSEQLTSQVAPLPKSKVELIFHHLTTSENSQRPFSIACKARKGHGDSYNFNAELTSSEMAIVFNTLYRFSLSLSSFEITKNGKPAGIGPSKKSENSFDESAKDIDLFTVEGLSKCDNIHLQPIGSLLNWAKNTPRIFRPMTISKIRSVVKEKCLIENLESANISKNDGELWKKLIEFSTDPSVVYLPPTEVESIISATTDLDEEGRRNLIQEIASSETEPRLVLASKIHMPLAQINAQSSDLFETRKEEIYWLSSILAFIFMCYFIEYEWLIKIKGHRRAKLDSQPSIPRAYDKEYEEAFDRERLSFGNYQLIKHTFFIHYSNLGYPQLSLESI